MSKLLHIPWLVVASSYSVSVWNNAVARVLANHDCLSASARSYRSFPSVLLILTATTLIVTTDSVLVCSCRFSFFHRPRGPYAIIGAVLLYEGRTRLVELLDMDASANHVVIVGGPEVEDELLSIVFDVGKAIPLFDSVEE